MRYKRVLERLNVSTSETYILNLHNTLADWLIFSVFISKYRTNVDYCSRAHNVYVSMHLASPHHDELQQDKYGGQHFSVVMVALP